MMLLDEKSKLTRLVFYIKTPYTRTVYNTHILSASRIQRRVTEIIHADIRTKFANYSLIIIFSLSKIV
jgi:hypothetical protein